MPTFDIIVIEYPDAPAAERWTAIIPGGAMYKAATRQDVIDLAKLHWQNRGMTAETVTVDPAV
jgi:hypothetical protein